MRDPTSLSVSLIDPSYPISLLPQRTILMGSHGHWYFNVFFKSVPLFVCRSFHVHYGHALWASWGFFLVLAALGFTNAAVCTSNPDSRLSHSILWRGRPPRCPSPRTGASSRCTDDGVRTDLGPALLQTCVGKPWRARLLECPLLWVCCLRFSSSDSGGDNWTRQWVRGGHAWESSEMLPCQNSLISGSHSEGACKDRGPNVT